MSICNLAQQAGFLALIGSLLWTPVAARADRGLTRLGTLADQADHILIGVVTQVDAEPTSDSHTATITVWAM